MKEFFIQHAEKVVLGVSAVVAGWFLFSALSVKQYEKTPENFSTIISQARQNVTGSEPQIEDLPVLAFDEEYAKLEAKIDPEKFKLRETYFRPLELSYQFRGTPEILAPAAPELRVNRGLMVLTDRDAEDKANVKAFDQLLASKFPAELIWYLGNEKMPEQLGIIEDKKAAAARPAAEAKPGGGRARAIEPKRDGKENRKTARGTAWVEIVAEFPHANQLREYIKVLKEGYREAGVRYALAEVERQELTESMEWTEWSRIPWKKVFDLFDMAEKMEDPFEELPEGVVVNGLVMNTPERARVGDGEQIQVSRPLIPDKFIGTKRPIWTPEEENPRQPEDAPGAARVARPLADDPEDDNPVEEPDRRRTGGGTGGAFDNFNDVDIAMMRVFDFTVEPGRRYRYRIRAVLFNPNYDRPDVVDPDQSLDVFVVGPWSDPSEEIYVEPDTEAMLTETKARDARAQFVVYHWLGRVGRWVSQEFTHQVGQLIGSGNTRDVSVPVFDPKDGKVTVKKEAIDKGFTTGSALLEVSPGQVREKFGTGDITLLPPREIVLVNVYGDLIRHVEVDDLADPARIDRDTSIEEGLENPEGGRKREDGDRNDSKESSDRPGRGLFE